MSTENEPKTDREIIILTVLSEIPGNYRGYVHVKTDHDNVVLPVDIDIIGGGFKSAEYVPLIPVVEM